MKHLTVEDLRLVITSRVPVLFHPDYLARNPQYDQKEKLIYITAIKKELTSEFEVCWVRKGSTYTTELYLRPDGLGIWSGIPVFMPQNEVTTTVSTVALPKNNDGRSECAFCGGPTRKAGGGIYDICTKCGR
jgi:hypothetical protein